MRKFFTIVTLAALAAAPATRPATRTSAPTASTRPSSTRPSDKTAAERAAEYRQKIADEKAEREAKRIGLAIARGEVLVGMSMEEATDAAHAGQYHDNRSYFQKLEPGETVRVSNRHAVTEENPGGKAKNVNLYLLSGPAGCWVVRVKDKTLSEVERVGWTNGPWVYSKLTR